MIAPYFVGAIMRVGSLGAITLITALLVAGTAGAKSLRADDGPAEYPPASYTSNQYVDSRGCVYIRAGYAGQVTWVPRVSRERKVMCGFKPTFAAAAPVAPAPKVAQPAPRKVVAPRPAAPAPVAAPTVKKVPAPVPAPAPKVRVAPKPAAPACPGASALSQQYINRSGTVRCGPQSDSPYTSGALETPRGRVVSQLPPVTIPKGYRPVWKDDRLNPQRGIGTAAGQAAMDQVWTREVPARLVTSVPADERLVVSTKSAKSAPVAQAKPRVTVSTKSAPVTPKVTAAAAKAVKARYVQVGSYAVPENASRAVARLQAMGLPVRLGRGQIGGKPVQVVYAGPFADPAHVTSALGAVRKAGYRDAFLR